MASGKKDLGAQLLRLLSLPGDVTITSSNYNNNSEIITLHLPSSERRCPICDSNNCIIRGSGRWQEYNHFLVNNRSIHLRIFKPRMYCQDCTSSFYQTPDWVIPRLRMTKSLFRVIYRNFTEMNDFSKISNNLMKHLQYPLLISRIKFYDQYGDKAEEKFQRLESAFEIAPELEEVYNAYQDFLDIVSANGFKYQRERLNNWIHEYNCTTVSKLYTAVTTIKHNKSYILNAWQYNRSNGPCEGLNKKIKDVKRSMYGAHSFENLRKRILLTCGNVDIESPMLVIHYDIKKRGSSPHH